MEIVHEGELNCLVGTRFYFSPTHDIILVFSGSRRLQLSPVDLSRNYFQSKFPKNVVSFGWDCYGRTFTVAADDNRVSIHDIELNGRAIHSFRLREPVTEVFWIRSPKLSHFFDPDDIKRDLEVLKKIPTHDKYDEGVFDQTPLLIKKKNGIHILCLSSKTSLRFYFFSIFQFCSIRLRRFIRDIENVEIVKTLVSPNFMLTSLLIRHKEMLKLVVLNTRKLGLLKSPLYVISLNFCHLSRMLLNVKKILFNLQKLWSLFFNGLFKGKVMNRYRKAFFHKQDKLYEEEEKRKIRIERKERRRRERERDRQQRRRRGRRNNEDDDDVLMEQRQPQQQQQQQPSEETISIEDILNHSFGDDDHDDDNDNNNLNDEFSPSSFSSSSSSEEEEEEDRSNINNTRSFEFHDSSDEEPDLNNQGFNLDEKEFEDVRNYDETCDHMKNFFIQYILYGKMNEGLIDFLTKYLPERYIVRILRSFKHLRRGMITYVLKYLTHYILHCIYRLSWLQGCTKWKEKFGPLGLKETDIHDLMEEFQNLHILSRQMVNRVNDFSKNFITFLQYLRYLHFVEILSDEPDHKNLEFPLTQYIDDGEIKQFLNDIKNLENFVGVKELMECYVRIEKKFLPVFNPLSRSLAKSVKKMGIVSITKYPMIPTNVPTQYFHRMNKRGGEEELYHQQEQEMDDNDEDEEEEEEEESAESEEMEEEGEKGDNMMRDEDDEEEEYNDDFESKSKKKKKKNKLKKKKKKKKKKKQQQKQQQKQTKRTKGIIIEMKNIENFQFFGFLYHSRHLMLLRWDTSKGLKFRREILTLHIQGYEVKSFKFVHLIHSNDNRLKEEEEGEEEEEEDNEMEFGSSQGIPTKKKILKNNKMFGRIVCLMTKRRSSNITLSVDDLQQTTSSSSTNQQLQQKKQQQPQQLAVHTLGIINLRNYNFSPIIPKISIDRILRTKGPHHVKLEQFELLKTLPPVTFDFLEVRDGNLEVDYVEGGAGEKEEEEEPTSSNSCVGCVYSSHTNYYVLFRMAVDENDQLVVSSEVVENKKKKEGRKRKNKMEDE